jgi:hypothetical protein
MTPRDVQPAITLARELVIWEAAGDSSPLRCLPTLAERAARIMAELFAGSVKVSKVVRALARLAKGEGDADYLSIPQYPSSAAWRLFLPSCGGDVESVLAELRTRESVLDGEPMGESLFTCQGSTNKLSSPVCQSARVGEGWRRSPSR